MMPAPVPVQSVQPSPVGPVGLLMTDDLLVATQGGAQRDVRPSSGPPEQPRVGTDALSQHVSGASRTASPGGLESLEALELLGVLEWFCDSCQSVQGRATGATLGHHDRTTGPGPGARCQEN